MITLGIIFKIILVLAALIAAFGVFAHYRFKVLFNLYSTESTKINGAKAARLMLDHFGITDVKVSVYPFDGDSFDAYNKELKAVFLRKDIYHGKHVAAIAIACHEAAHAVQHDHNFNPLLQWGFLLELDASKRAIAWVTGDVARSFGFRVARVTGVAKLLRWSLFTYLKFLP